MGNDQSRFFLIWGFLNWVMGCAALAFGFPDVARILFILATIKGAFAYFLVRK